MTPKTEAARQMTLNSRTLFEMALASRTQEVTITAQALAHLLPAIEAEAVAAYRAALITAMEGLPWRPGSLRVDGDTVPKIDRAAVLDLIRTTEAAPHE